MANIKVKRSAVPGKIPLTTDLQLGEFAVNTHDGKVYIKKNVSGVETVEAINTPALQNLQNRYSYAVSGSSQSTFSAQYVVPYVDVYLNGVHLASSDYIATNGTSVVLNTAAQVGDVVEIVALNSYTANSDFLNVPGGIATADFLKFDTTATNTPEVAKLNWNADDGTLEFGLKGGQVVLQVGQEQVQRIYNNTGSTLVPGQVVYVTGSQGNRLTVALASASSEATSTRTFGIVTETILNETEGFIATSGLVRGLNTSSFAEGSVLWLGTSAGTYTTTRPAAPNHGVLVGFVVRQHASVGSVFVHIANGYELDELHDVLIASKQDGQALVYEASSGLWKNKFVDYNTLLNKPTLVTQTDINNAIASLVDTAPATLDTLNELAAALGDDPNFATTVTNLVATKLSLSGGTMTGDITFSGTQTWPTFNQNTTGNAATSTTATNVSGGSASVTTLTTSGAVTHNGGTANGVAYLNGSKVLTTGSALTFSETGNETKLGIKSISGTSTYTAGIAVNWDDNAFILYGGSGYKILETLGYSTPNVLKFFTNNAEQMRLTSTGLGIGTSSPGHRLDVTGAAGTFAGIRVNASSFQNAGLIANRVNNGNTAALYFTESGANQAYIMSYGSAYGSGLNGALQIVNGSNALTYDSSGNLGLGVTPSAWSLLGAGIQMKGHGSLVGRADGVVQTSYGLNNYFNGTNYIYLESTQATQYQQYQGQHIWKTAPSGTAGNAISFTQAMTLDANGRLGIGTTSPNTRLHVDAPATTGNVDALTISNNSNNENDAVSCVWLLGGSRKATIQAIQPGSSATVLTFNTQISGGSFGERARIDSSGNLLVGTTTANAQLTVSRNNYYSPAIYASIGSTTSGGGGFAYFKQTANDNGDAFVSIDRGRTDFLGGLRFLTGGSLDFSFGCGGVPGVGGGNSLQLRNSSGTRVFDINSSNGDVKNQNNSYGSLSDARLKENVTDATPKLDDLNKLRVVNFNLKEDPDKRKQIGLIAQEVEQVFPGLVDTEGDEKIMSVKYSVLVPMLLKAVQELNAKVEALTAELNTLKGQA